MTVAWSQLKAWLVAIACSAAAEVIIVSFSAQLASPSMSGWCRLTLQDSVSHDDSACFLMQQYALSYAFHIYTVHQLKHQHGYSK